VDDCTIRDSLSLASFNRSLGLRIRSCFLGRSFATFGFFLFLGLLGEATL
jgi:hypothetical protein